MATKTVTAGAMLTGIGTAEVKDKRKLKAWDTHGEGSDLYKDWKAHGEGYGGVDAHGDGYVYWKAHDAGLQWWRRRLRGWVRSRLQLPGHGST